jgi:outer membrane murein-binding lipoprotein Lpp
MNTHCRYAKFATLLGLVLLAGCAKPDQALLDAIGQDVVRIEASLDRYVEQLNELQTIRDSLNHRFLGSLNVAGKRAFLSDTNSLNMYQALQSEAQNSLNLYQAFVLEYSLSTDEFQLWHKNAAESGASDDAIREAWKKYVTQFATFAIGKKLIGAKFLILGCNTIT